MNIKQKKLLHQNGIKVPNGFASHSLDNALQVAKQIGYPCIIKAQVHAGGRGKAGGVKLVKNEIEAKSFINGILNKPLITIQNAPSGQPVNTILLEELSSIKKELYLGMVIDREFDKVCIIASSEGGTEIEEIAKDTPDKIIKQWVDLSIGVHNYHIRNIYKRLGLESDLYKQFSQCVKALYNVFVNNDVSLIEINPLCINDANIIIALDAKIVFDDNALYRLPNIVSLTDNSQENHREIEAKKK
jgi:succinyl-CoA synthetase beta subunit